MEQLIAVDEALHCKAESEELYKWSCDEKSIRLVFSMDIIG